MGDTGLPRSETRLRELTVKSALKALDWTALQGHLDEIKVSKVQVNELCGHIRRYSDLICKYSRSGFDRRRARFCDQLQAYVETQAGRGAAAEIAAEMALIVQIEHGYRSILGVLARRAIGHQPADVRVSGVISRACQEYQELMRQRDKTLADTRELNLLSGLHLKDDNDNSISMDAVLDGLSESVAITLIMEAHKNGWFVDDTVVLPKLPVVNDEVRYQSGSTQVLALC